MRLSLLGFLLVAVLAVEARHHFRHSSAVDLEDLEDYLGKIRQHKDFLIGDEDELDNNEEGRHQKLRDAFKGHFKASHPSYNDEEKEERRHKMLKDAFSSKQHHHPRTVEERLRDAFSSHHNKDENLINSEFEELNFKKDKMRDPSTSSTTTTTTATTTTPTPSTTITTSPSQTVRPTPKGRRRGGRRRRPSRLRRILIAMARRIQALEGRENRNHRILFRLYRQVVVMRRQMRRLQGSERVDRRGISRIIRMILQSLRGGQEKRDNGQIYDEDFEEKDNELE